MTRITSTVLAIMLLLNGTTAIMEVSGLSDDMGIHITTGVDNQMDKFITDMKNGFNPNVNIIQSFVSLALAGARIFLILINAVYTAPTLMINIFGGGQLVTTVVYAFMGPMYMIATLEMLYMATGNDAV